MEAEHKAKILRDLFFGCTTSSSSCSVTETIPSPVGPTSFSRSLFSGCMITECGYFHCCKIFLLSSPTCPGSTLKVRGPVSSCRAWVSISSQGFQKPEAQIITSNMNLVASGINHQESEMS